MEKLFKASGSNEHGRMDRGKEDYGRSLQLKLPWMDN